MKGRQGAKTVKQMLRALQEGHRVCIFPEGNRSFNGVTMDMETSIAKVAKKSKAKLVTFRIEGGYLTQPRWSTTTRRGKTRGRLINVYTPEQLAEMSDGQISEAIITDLSWVGSILIFVVGLNLTFDSLKIRVGNMIPALLVPIVYGFLPF